MFLKDIFMHLFISVHNIFFKRFQVVCTLMLIISLNLYLCLTQTYAEDSLISVTKAVWTNGIDKSKDPKKIYKEVATGTQPLYLWMHIRGSERALEILSSQGKLPIRHKWYKYIGYAGYFDESQTPIDAIELSVGKKAKLDELSLEIKTRGYFDWRTWSMKRNIKPGWWKVIIVYANDDPVLCEEKPCAYAIEVE